MFATKQYNLYPFVVGAILLGACAPPADCPRCDTLVIAALGEPDHLAPPLIWESVGRDISDLVYQRLADLDPRRSPLDPAAYRPGLATRWEQVDPVTWRFHLDPGRRWHDGTPVTAADVVWSFAAHADPVLDAPARGSVAGLTVVAEDDSTVRIGFGAARPDQLYDATWHVRIFPAHLWRDLPPAVWGDSARADRFVGSGPYRVAGWVKGQSLTLEAVDPEAAIARVVWRFAGAPEPAASLALTGEADLLETLPDPAQRELFARESGFALESYPSAVYGFLGFNLARPGPWRDPRVRRGLALGADRDPLAAAIFGAGTVVPPGPLSRQLWLWEDGVPGWPYDTIQAAALLDSAGWIRTGSGRRMRGGMPLAMDILVPGTSATRRSLAIALQERWGRLGVEATITSVDFPVFQERLGAGRFDSYLGAWLDEPNPRSLRDQWTRAGWDRLNYGRYHNPGFDQLLAAAVSDADTGRARAHWRDALAVLNADVPAIWLYTPTNVAVVSRRISHPPLAPFGWLGRLEGWGLTPP